MQTARVSALLPEELSHLKAQWRLTDRPSDDPERSIDCEALLDPANAAAYLARIRDVYGETTPPAAAASQFAKRYGYLAVAPTLFAMTMYDKGLDFAPGNCRIESAFREGVWLPHVRLADLRVTMPGTDRAAWREEVVGTIFAGHLANVLASVAKAAKVPLAILWENAAVYVYWLYEKALAKEADGERSGRIADDYRYLLEAPARAFGIGHNPLAKCRTPRCRQAADGELVRVRQTCCLHYQASDQGGYCTTCPLIGDR